MILRTFVLLGAAALLVSCNSSHFEPPRRLGPPTLVLHENEPRLWLLLQHEEQKLISLGRGGRSTGRTVRETHYHYDLQAHDSRTTERIWKKRLLTLKDREGGSNAEARILGQDGAVVWLFLNGKPVALSALDGSAVADGSQIEERNAALQGVMPKELKFYAFDAGLVITAVDSRLYKIRASDLGAEAYKPASDDHFRDVQFMATRWNGGYTTADFLTRQATLGGRWLGLYSEKEAADAGDDEFGDSLKRPESVLNEGTRARRSVWSARIGKTKEFSEGAHDRLFDVTAVPGAPDFLQAGFLVRHGTKQPLVLPDPESALVLYNTRLDTEGRLALTRLDAALRAKWTAKLPIQELGNRYEFPDRLLMYGATQLTEDGITTWQEFITAVDLRDGASKAWNVALERSIAPTALEKER